MKTRHQTLRLLRTFALAALTAAVTAACSDDTDNDREPLTPPDGYGGIPVAFTADINPGSDANPAGTSGTRTVLHPTENGGFTVTWKGTDNYPYEADQIYIRAVRGTDILYEDEPTINYPTTAASSTLEPMDDGVTLTLPEAGDWTFKAVCNSISRNGSNEPTVGVSMFQSGPGSTDHIAQRDFSVATATENIAAANSEMPQSINLRFEHKLSALQRHVTNGTSADLTVKEIRLALAGDKIDIVRVFDVVTGDWKTEIENKSDYLQLKIRNSEALAPSGGTMN